MTARSALTDCQGAPSGAWRSLYWTTPLSTAAFVRHWMVCVVAGSALQVSARVIGPAGSRIRRLAKRADEVGFAGPPPHRREKDVAGELGGHVFQDEFGPVVVGQRAGAHEALGIPGGHEAGHPEGRARALGAYGDEVVRAVLVEAVDAEFDGARVEAFLPDLIGVVLVADGERGLLKARLDQPERRRGLFVVPHDRHHHGDIHLEGPVFGGKNRALFRGDERPDGFIVERGQFVEGQGLVHAFDDAVHDRSHFGGRFGMDPNRQKDGKQAGGDRGFSQEVGF